MVNRIAELTPEELATLKSLISETVSDAMRDLLDVLVDDDETDEGLTFKPEFIARIKESLRDDSPGRPAADLYRELGLDV